MAGTPTRNMGTKVRIDSSGLSYSETVSTGGFNKTIFPDPKTKLVLLFTIL
jgi:hypothetical protein